MSEGDWDPLPPEQLCRNPGEFVTLGKRSAPPVATPAPTQAQAPSPPPAAPPPPPDDPAATAALQALHQKLASSPPPSSWVAQSLQRERRAQVRRANAGKAGQLAATLVQAEPAAPPAPQVEYALGLEGRDAREEEPWFLALPEAERVRLHDVWAQKRMQEAGASVVQRRNRNRRMQAAIACFGLVLLLGTGALWHATVGAGIVCGIWWRHAGADRFLDPIRALVCFGGMQGLAMAVARSPNPQLFLDAILLIAFAALVGFEGEIRRTGGFDAH